MTIRQNHGQTKTRLYQTWCNMKNRCYNKNVSTYYRYGERGISVCDEWMTFVPFYDWALRSGYNDDLTLDRIDNDMSYCPDNCRWVTYKVQNNNKTNNKILTYNGVSLNETQWAKVLGLSRGGFRSRIRAGLKGDALFSPKQLRGKSTNKKRNRLRDIWNTTKSKCLSPSSYLYSTHGGRGTLFYEEWLDFDIFKEWSYNNGYGDCLGLYRIDPSGNFEPDNCVWQTREKASIAGAIKVTHNGETLTIKEWAAKLDISYGVFYNRLKRGDPEEKLFSVNTHKKIT